MPSECRWRHAVVGALRAEVANGHGGEEYQKAGVFMGLARVVRK